MRAFYLFTVLAIALDQLSKWTVIHGMELARIRAIDVFPPFLNFRYGENRGINFGLFDSSGNPAWLLVGMALIICAVVIWWVRRNPQSTYAYISAGLLVGGAVGNVVDRLFYGYVLDFLNMSCCGYTNPFVFNVADIFIFAGAIGLVFFADDGSSAKKAG
ncbi:MAG: signal peptidase II [Rhodobacteraceae bacterium]|nr:signal peptidase II [Paracoccaceae bacterium]